MSHGSGMEDLPEEHSEALSQFMSITGAPHHVAEHYLSAYNWDLDRGIAFFFDNPPSPRTTAAQHGTAGAGGRAAAGGQEAFLDDPIIPDDMAAMDPDLQEAMMLQEQEYGLAAGRSAGSGSAPAPGPRTVQAQAGPQLFASGTGLRGPASGPASGAIDLSAEDDELQQALAESLREVGAPGGARPGPGPGFGASRGTAAGGGYGLRSRPVEPDLVESPDDDADAMELEAMARQREAAMQAAREAERDMEAMMDMARGVMGRMGAAPPFAAAGPASMFPGLDADFPLPRDFLGGSRAAGPPPSHANHSASGPSASRIPGASSAAAAAATHHVGSGSRDMDPDLDLPEGVDPQELEEARMLEAALLGVPYEGRLPSTSYRDRPPPGPVDPDVAAQRFLRDEQDAAYEESLRADRAKAEAAARAKAEAEAAARAAEEAAAAAARAQAEETARAARAKAEAEAKLQAKLKVKRGRLPAEPAAGTAESISVVFRLPDGSRHSRRFMKSDPLHALFDYIDLTLAQQQEAAAATAGGDTAAAGSALQPGSYSLVNSYPRRVFQEAQGGSLADAGLTADSALFIEPRAA